MELIEFSFLFTVYLIHKRIICTIYLLMYLQACNYDSIFLKHLTNVHLANFFTRNCHYKAILLTTVRISSVSHEKDCRLKQFFFNCSLDSSFEISVSPAKGQDRNDSFSIHANLCTLREFEKCQRCPRVGILAFALWIYIRWVYGELF